MSELGMMKVEEIGRMPMTLADTGKEVELVYKEVKVPEDLIYIIGSGSAGILSSGYDLFAREMGISFSDPEIISEDENTVEIQVKARYYNAQGNPIQDAETYRIDTRNLFELSRLKWEPTKWVQGQGKVTDEAAVKKFQEQGYLVNEVVYDGDSIPIKIKRKLPPEIESEIYQNFLTLKANKLAKCITCAHRRLTQRALGVKGIVFDRKDKEGKWKQEATVRIHAFIPKKSTLQAVKCVNDLYDDDALPAEEDAAEIAEVLQGQKPVSIPEKPKNDNGGSSGKGVTCQGKDCGRIIESEKVVKFSTERYGAPLCFDCQNARKAVA